MRAQHPFAARRPTILVAARSRMSLGRTLQAAAGLPPTDTQGAGSRAHRSTEEESCHHHQCSVDGNGGSKSKQRCGTECVQRQKSTSNTEAEECGDPQADSHSFYPSVHREPSLIAISLTSTTPSLQAKCLRQDQLQQSLMSTWPLACDATRCLSYGCTAPSGRRFCRFSA